MSLDCEAQKECREHALIWPTINLNVCVCVKDDSSSQWLGTNVAKHSAPPDHGRALKVTNYVLLIAAIIALLQALVLPRIGRSDRPTQQDKEQEQVVVEDAQEQESSESPESSEPQEEKREEEQDLAWRDTDFAVDPARQDWNEDVVDRKVVYLTIDDGPSENTQAVLDILDRYGCKATFFVVGHNPDYYYLIGEAYRRGHTIGLHTYSHDYETVYSSVDAYYADLDAIGQVVKEQIGYVPCFIRFPGGSSNEVSANYSVGIMSVLVDSVREQGYQYFDWNMSTGDGAEHTADEIVGYATQPTEYQNIVLLCHDSATKQSTVEALPRIIEHYQALGYTFEAIDRNTIVTHHGVNN